MNEGSDCVNVNVNVNVHGIFILVSLNNVNPNTFVFFVIICKRGHFFVYVCVSFGLFLLFAKWNYTYILNCLHSVILITNPFYRIYGTAKVTNMHLWLLYLFVIYVVEDVNVRSEAELNSSSWFAQHIYAYG